MGSIHCDVAFSAPPRPVNQSWDALLYLDRFAHDLRCDTRSAKRVKS
jgi:hypothetical protein